MIIRLLHVLHIQWLVGQMLEQYGVTGFKEWCISWKNSSTNTCRLHLNYKKMYVKILHIHQVHYWIECIIQQHMLCFFYHTFDEGVGSEFNLFSWLLGMAKAVHAAAVPYKYPKILTPAQLPSSLLGIPKAKAYQ